MRIFLTHIANVLLKMALERGVRAALPRIFTILDRQMPQLLEQGEPAAVTAAVGDAISVATKGKVKPVQNQIEAIVGLYSPIAGAAKKLLK